MRCSDGISVGFVAGKRRRKIAVDFVAKGRKDLKNKSTDGADEGIDVAEGFSFPLWKPKGFLYILSSWLLVKGVLTLDRLFERGGGTPLERGKNVTSELVSHEKTSHTELQGCTI